MIKNCLEVSCLLLINNSSMQLCDTFYDLEYQSLSAAINLIKFELNNTIINTALSNGSTINDFLLRNNLVDIYKSKKYNCLILFAPELIEELSKPDE